MKKRIWLLLLMLIVTVIFSACSESEVTLDAEKTSVSGNIEMVCENGQIAVKGSFDNQSLTCEEYTVSCNVVRDGNTEKPLVLSKDFKLEQGENSFEIKLKIGAKQQSVSVSVVSEDGQELCAPCEKSFKSLKILSIGNSFSVDAQQWLYGIAKDAGYDNVILGNLYFGGCSLERHYRYIEDKDTSYTYYKNTTGEWTQKDGATALEAIVDESWDYITLQQSSGISGLPETYEPHLSRIINYVKLNKTNPNAELVWHMTWAYSSDSTHQDYKNYDNDQRKMYEGIVNAVKENVLTNPDISFVIPSGTAIQNARTTSLGDTLCRDGFHLDLNYGRYLAGLTWFHKITGQPIDDIEYIPEGAFDKECLEVLKECAKNAVATPFEVTRSVYTENP